MDNDDLKFDADSFYKNYNKKEQDAKDLKEGLERQAEDKKQKEEYIRNEEDKISDQLFDCRFKDQSSGREYQLAIERITNEKQTIECNIGWALVETILLNNYPGFDIEAFLEYQLSYCKESDKKFLNNLGSLFQFGLFARNGSGIVPKNFKGKLFNKWIKKKLKLIERPEIKVAQKNDNKVMTRRACSLAYYYIQAREKGFKQLTTKNADDICKELKFKFSGRAIRNEIYTYGNREKRIFSSGNTKSDNSLIKDFGLCITYLSENNYVNAKRVAETELAALLSNTKPIR